MGKSLYVQNMAKELSEHRNMSTVTARVPIHGPKLAIDWLIQSLSDYMDNQHCIIHFDIAPIVRMLGSVSEISCIA